MDKFKVLEGIVLLGIGEISVFAFSIENYKRTQEEVDLLFEISVGMMSDIRTNKDFLKEKKIGFRFVGNLDLLPLRAQVLMGEINQVFGTYEQR